MTNSFAGVALWSDRPWASKLYIFWRLRNYSLGRFSKCSVLFPKVPGLEPRVLDPGLLSFNLCHNLFWYFLVWIDLVPCPEVWVQLPDWKSWIWRTTISMKSHYLETFQLWVSDVCNEACVNVLKYISTRSTLHLIILAFCPQPVAAFLSFVLYRPPSQPIIHLSLVDFVSYPLLSCCSLLLQNSYELFTLGTMTLKPCLLR